MWLVALLMLLSAGLLQGQEGKRLLAVCSTTQVADFTRQVVGDRWEVRSILAPGQDPHVYEIKPGDSQLVSQADLCVENGWHLEGKEWMSKLAHGANKPLVTGVEGLEPLKIEGEGITLQDPHAWFTPLNAATYVRNIVRGVSTIDPEHKAEYEARAELYLNQLRTLHLWIQRQVSQLPPSQRVLVTSHDAFGYFCAGYGFVSKSPTGWSTGDEVGGGATPERQRQVAESLRQFGVKAIFVETSVNPKLIRQIANDAGVQIGGELYSDSMGPPGSAGETYIGMMRENVLTIVHALK
ncbi:Manganese ABC transporter substrate-binding lipoprotein precursor [Lignipirellula cremea]|uniref:Manganese ABC transporter substrate-binding lipoprotein n=2 Tax=Lignipirellula cremea TaxID=2528010 RepID=A0A518DN62_9BACT|nr:Manganese ABC transporter substrate-binding lipoprotein precursor [Lignipirellula cremea]